MKRRCRAEEPGGSEIMIGSIGTKATSPRTVAAASAAVAAAAVAAAVAAVAAAADQRRRVEEPGIDRVEAAAAEREGADEPEDQPELALASPAAASSAISAASVMAAPIVKVRVSVTGKPSITNQILSMPAEYRRPRLAALRTPARMQGRR